MAWSRHDQYLGRLQSWPLKETANKGENEVWSGRIRGGFWVEPKERKRKRERERERERERKRERVRRTVEIHERADDERGKSEFKEDEGMRHYMSLVGPTCCRSWRKYTVLLNLFLYFPLVPQQFAFVPLPLRVNLLYEGVGKIQ